MKPQLIINSTTGMQYVLHRGLLAAIFIPVPTDSHSRERAPECLPQGERLFRVVFHLEVAFV